MLNVFLSRIIMNLHSAAARSDLASFYSMHRRLWKAFPGDYETRPFLFRLERMPDTHRILVLSSVEPQWEEIHPYYSEEIRVKKLDPVKFQFEREQILRYRITVNPTRAIPNSNKRYEYYKDADILNWWEGKASEHGFRVMPNSTVIVKKSKRTSYSKPQNRFITLEFVMLEGFLQVKEPEKFSQALISGIGRGKAFGCGLMSVLPLSKDLLKGEMYA